MDKFHYSVISLYSSRVHHSTQAIIKPLPQNKSNEAAQKEIEEAVNRAREEAQQSILTATSSCLVPEDTGNYQSLI